MIWLLLFRIIWAWKWFILLSGFACCAVAVVVAYQTSPIYQSSARVQIDVIGPDPVTGVGIDPRYATAYTATQIELIRDYAVAGRVVDTAGFVNSPEMAAQYRATVPDQSIDFRRWLAQQVIAGTSAGLIQESNALEIRYTATSPVIAAMMVELIRSSYIEQSLAFEQERARRNADYFAAEADKLRNQLAAAQAAKTAFEQENGVIVAQDGQSIDEIRVASLATALPSFRPPRQQAAVAAPSAATLAEVQARISAASQSLGPNHPALVQMREQEAALRAAVARETAALNVEAASGQPSTEGVTAARIDRLLDRAEATDEARRLLANVNVLRGQYLEAMKRAADLRLEARSLDVGIVPIGEVSPPTDPLSPNWWLVVGLSLGFGLALGCLTALLLELLGRPVRSAEDLEMDGIPILNAKLARPPEHFPEPSTTEARWPFSLSRLFRSRQPA